MRDRLHSMRGHHTTKVTKEHTMGLLDSVLGQVLGSAAQQQPRDAGHQDGGTNAGGLGGLGGLAGALGGLLANDGGHGGLGGLVNKFEHAGLGDVIGSWIGKGDNAPISGGQLGSVLGDNVVGGLAQKLGMNASTLLPLLASMLPMLIDRLTPHGRVPEQGLGDLSELGGAGGAFEGFAPQDGTPDAAASGSAMPGSENELLAQLSALLPKR
jgi:uncharacterized protein YidB (DUF937 family)